MAWRDCSWYRWCPAAQSIHNPPILSLPHSSLLQFFSLSFPIPSVHVTLFQHPCILYLFSCSLAAFFFPLTLPPFTDLYLLTPLTVCLLSFHRHYTSFLFCSSYYHSPSPFLFLDSLISTALSRYPFSLSLILLSFLSILTFLKVIRELGSGKEIRSYWAVLQQDHQRAYTCGKSHTRGV